MLAQETALYCVFIVDVLCKVYRKRDKKNAHCFLSGLLTIVFDSCMMVSVPPLKTLVKLAPSRAFEVVTTPQPSPQAVPFYRMTSATSLLTILPCASTLLVSLHWSVLAVSVYRDVSDCSRVTHSSVRTGTA